METTETEKKKEWARPVFYMALGAAAAVIVIGSLELMSGYGRAAIERERKQVAISSQYQFDGTIEGETISFKKDSGQYASTRDDCFRLMVRKEDGSSLEFIDTDYDQKVDDIYSHNPANEFNNWEFHRREKYGNLRELTSGEEQTAALAQAQFEKYLSRISKEKQARSNGYLETLDGRLSL